MQFFSKCTIFVFVTFFSCLVVNQLNFLVAVRVYKIHVFDEAVFFLTIRMPLVTKHFRVVPCCEELSPMKTHGIST